MHIETRRKRAVFLATTPAILSAVFAALAPRMGGHPMLEVGLTILLLACIVCLAFALRELAALKREGNKQVL